MDHQVAATGFIARFVSIEGTFLVRVVLAMERLSLVNDCVELL